MVNPVYAVISLLMLGAIHSPSYATDDLLGTGWPGVDKALSKNGTRSIAKGACIWLLGGKSLEQMYWEADHTERPKEAAPSPVMNGFVLGGPGRDIPPPPENGPVDYSKHPIVKPWPSEKPDPLDAASASPRTYGPSVRLWNSFHFPTDLKLKAEAKFENRRYEATPQRQIVMYEGPRHLRTFESEPNLGQIRGLKLSPNGKILAIVYARAVRFLDASSASLHSLGGHDCSCENVGIDFTPNSEHALVYTDTLTVHKFGGQWNLLAVGGAFHVTQNEEVYFSKDGKYVLTVRRATGFAEPTAEYKIWTEEYWRYENQSETHGRYKPLEHGFSRDVAHLLWP